MMYLLTGGSGSGKSAYGEKKICSFGDCNRIYIATMENKDGESQKRVERHRKLRRGLGFTTIEQGKQIKSLQIPRGSVVLLECMSNLLANEMYGEGGAGERAVQEILEGIFRLNDMAAELVVVTNEVFSDLPVDREMGRYLKCLGEINAAIAREAAEVVELVYGIPVWIKGLKK